MSGHSADGELFALKWAKLDFEWEKPPVGGQSRHGIVKSPRTTATASIGKPLNPFSFQEFLRWRNHQRDPDVQAYCSLKPLQVVQDRMTSYPEADSCFSAPQDDEEGGDEGWECSHYLDQEEGKTRLSSSPEEQKAARPEDQSPTSQAGAPCRNNGESTHAEQLEEENILLRGTINKLQRKLEISEQTASRLSKELLKRRQQEEQEAQDLESMVHSVEQNLQLVTNRALKAESSVSRLKQEVKLLQAQLEASQLENEHLKEADSEIVVMMRHNAQMASEYLQKTASQAQSSISQLLREAETLHLVSQLLKSIDKLASQKT